MEAGAAIVDLNIGPQKKLGHEVMPWIVETIQSVVEVPLSLDTTNLAAMEAGLKVCKRRAMLNSASADPARLESVFDLAARYGARVVALTMGVDGIPTTADGRAGIAMETLMPAAEAPASRPPTCSSTPRAHRDLQPGRGRRDHRRHPHLQADRRSAAYHDGGHLQRLQRRPPEVRPLINRT